jgi:hypothetical protein
MADFGSDFAGVGDFNAALSFCEGEQCLAEAIANRLQARKGSLLGDPDYGEGLNDLLNEAMGDNEISAAKRRIEVGCVRDERVSDASATCEFDSATGALATDIAIETAEGPFQFTLKASASAYEVIFGT